MKKSFLTKVWTEKQIYCLGYVLWKILPWYMYGHGILLRIQQFFYRCWWIFENLKNLQCETKFLVVIIIFCLWVLIELSVIGISKIEGYSVFKSMSLPWVLAIARYRISEIISLLSYFHPFFHSVFHLLIVFRAHQYSCCLVKRWKSQDRFR